jgi:hypothetical protein
MAELKNYTQTLDDVILKGKNLGQGTFVCIAHVNDRSQMADNGVELAKMLRAEKHWVQDSVFVPDATLPVSESISVLSPDNDRYAAMMIVVPAKNTRHGMPVVFARPNVEVLHDGTKFGMFMYNPTARAGFDGAYLNNPGKTSLLEFMSGKTDEMIKSIAGKDAFILGYDEDTPGLFKEVRPSIVGKNGWKSLVTGMGVPSLEDGANPNREVAKLNFVYRAEKKPTLSSTIAYVSKYLAEGYEIGSRLMKTNADRIVAQYK